MTIIHNGTDAVADADAERSPLPRIIVLGRLVPQKRVELALDAVAALREQVPGLHLDVVGSGWWEPQLREHVAALGLEDDVTFHGHVSETEKHRLLARAWVHAMPSLKEGWGLVVVEAGVHGTPTVAFRSAGGPADSIVDGETGLLVDDADGRTGRARLHGGAGVPAHRRRATRADERGRPALGLAVPLGGLRRRLGTPARGEAAR